MTATAFAAFVILPVALSIPRRAHERASERDERAERGEKGERGETHRERQKIPEIAATARQRIAEAERVRFASKMPGAMRTYARVPSESWINLGPADAFFEYNGGSLSIVDSGRPAAMVIDPRDPNVVYLATAGGGIWKTYDFVDSAPNPRWHPISDDIENLAIGAMDISQSNPDILIIGTGDPYDVPGRSVYKSADGGATWSAPIHLEGTYPQSAGGLKVHPNSIRDLKIDPRDPMNVLVATDVGLFRSNDGGMTYALIDLENAGTTQVPEATWSLAYVGTKDGKTIWLATGVYACDPTSIPPWANYGVLAGGMSFMTNDQGTHCAVGNLGDVWKSTDSGQTWISIRKNHGFPPIPVYDVGRIQLGAGATTEPDHTVVYAMLAAGDENNSQTQGFWRSDDGGSTWNDVTGALANPTTADMMGNRDCGDMNIGHDQAWYNAAIAVDPTNPDRVIAGGNLCGVRTLNGTAPSPTWENVSHWLPLDQSGGSTEGILPYVHADWHNAMVSASGGTVRVFAMTDGGLFSSTNVFDPGTHPHDVVWEMHNKTLATHLIWGMGSGDPATGNPFTVITGLQDNGVRIRDSQHNPTTFNEVIGGDGFEAAVTTGTVGEVMMASNQGSHYYCIRQRANCNVGGNWNNFDPNIDPMMDFFPFRTRFSPVTTSTAGGIFLTTSASHVWRSSFNDVSNPTWVNVGNFDDYVRNVYASDTIRGLYGVALSGGHYAVTADAGHTWTKSMAQIGVVGTATLAEASSIAFPPVTPANKAPGDVYLAATEAWTLTDKSRLVPDVVGHLFVTQDRGMSFTPLHGNGTGMDLPNVPITVVRYDPGDSTNMTIYVGTDVGLYRSIDGGMTWSRFGNGLPLVRIEALVISKNSSMIRAGTYGRGVWEIYPSSSASKGVNGDGDFDRNGRIDWADLAALASRLGTDPSTTAWPTYSSIDDMTGGPGPIPVDSIDEGDLSLLLEVFGGHP